MSKAANCDIYCYDKEKVDRVHQEIMRNELTATVQLFKLLADENRVKIIYSLCLERELCVCDIANIAECSVATASYHLRALYKFGIVAHRQVGKLAFYSLENEHIKKLITLSIGLEQYPKLAYNNQVQS